MANKLVEMIDRNAIRYGDREAYRFCWRKGGEWLSTSWSDFAIQTNVAARSLAALGLKPLETIGICSPNTPQVLITEFGAFRNRAAVIPLYPSCSQEQFDYIIDNGEARILFVGDSGQYPLAYNYWKRHSDKLSAIVVFKNSEIERCKDDTVTIGWDDFVRLGMHTQESVAEEVKHRTEQGVPSDTATLIYTSGTTGVPKGVMLSHANYDAAMKAHLEALVNVSDKDLSMSFLPMSHIFEKAWCFFCLTKGIRIAVNYDPRAIQQTIHEVEPTLMCCVPRFWEKVYTSVQDKIASMSTLQRIAVRRALKTGRKRNLHYVRQGLRVPMLLEKEYAFWNRTVFSMLKKAIGIPCPNMFPTAGAALSDKITEFMRSTGINVTIGYGMTESTATITFFRPTGYEIGSVGRPLPGVEVKLSNDGEVLVKGATITAGYYKNDAANAEAFTANGFFRTGDRGYLTPDGSLVLTDRIKDLFKTSNGKYIAPQAIESRLAENKYISEAAVIGNRRKFVSALIVPNLSELHRWAAAQHIDNPDDALLIVTPKVAEFMLHQVDSTLGDMASFEKVKRITLLPKPFSLEKGEVTNTLKVRRDVVERNYASAIEKMYAE